MRLPVHLHPIGKFIIEGLPVVYETTFFDNQSTCVYTGPTGHPTHWPLAGYTFNRIDRSLHVFPFQVLWNDLIINPAVSVPDYLVSFLDGSYSKLRISLDGHPDGKNTGLDVSLFQNVQDPPTTSATPVLEARFDQYTALALVCRKTGVC